MGIYIVDYVGREPEEKPRLVRAPTDEAAKAFVGELGQLTREIREDQVPQLERQGIFLEDAT